MKEIHFLGDWWYRLKRRHRYTCVKCVDSMIEVPERTARGIYIVGSRESPKWAVFDCPCSRGHRLTVNLMRSRYPYWNLEMARETVSLTPSIVVTDHPCQSHFWLHRNRVRWVSD